LDRERGGQFPGHLDPFGFIPWHVFGGFLKDIIYTEKVQNVKDLHEILDGSADGVTSEILVSTWRGTEYSLDICRATNGAILRSDEHIGNFVRSSV
jgi:hypothetical protein